MRLKKSYLFIAFFIISFSFYGQTPLNDSNWELNALKSDEFNGTTLGSNWTGMNATNWTMPYYRTSNIELNGEKIKLKFIKEGNEYYTAGIMSKNSDYTYGFYEIVATLPKGQGFFPAFWLYADYWNPWPLKRDWYDEIDILESNGCYSIDAEVYSVGIWDKDGDRTITKTDEGIIENLPDLSSNEYRYAVEWLPNYVVFYFNDAQVYKAINQTAIPTHPMKVIINHQIGAECAPNKLTDIILPKYFEINYFRFYQLKMDCNSIVNQSNFDFSNFDYAVKKSYTLINSTIPQNSKITLRATDFIELKGTFIVPHGSELVIVPTVCH